MIRVAQKHEYSEARAKRILTNLLDVLKNIKKTETKIITIED